MSWMNHNFNPRKHTIFIPKFPEKYVGKGNPISRSSWEESFMNWCDMNNSIVKWSSEPIAIEYHDPVSRKDRRYYPDFMLCIRDKEGKETVHIIEIKPEKETIPPTKGKKKSEKTMVHESMTYATNTAKWKAAMSYCKKKSIEFHIITEKDLFRLK